MRGIVVGTLAGAALFAVPAARHADARPAAGDGRLSVAICVGDTSKDSCGPRTRIRVSGKKVLEAHLNDWPTIAKSAGTIVGPQINCPRVCSSVAAAGSSVTLTATPNTNPNYYGSYKFDHWEGSLGTCVARERVCSVTIGWATRLIAVFVSAG